MGRAVSFGLGSASSACSASRRSSRVEIFKLMVEPGTTVTAMPDSLDQLGVVGGGEVAPLGVGVEQQLPAKTCGVWASHSPVAGHGLFGFFGSARPA